jgi:hypothetical protein
MAVRHLSEVLTQQHEPMAASETNRMTRNRVQWAAASRIRDVSEPCARVNGSAASRIMISAIRRLLSTLLRRICITSTFLRSRKRVCTQFRHRQRLGSVISRNKDPPCPPSPPTPPFLSPALDPLRDSLPMAWPNTSRGSNWRQEVSTAVYPPSSIVTRTALRSGPSRVGEPYVPSQAGRATPPPSSSEAQDEIIQQYKKTEIFNSIK